MGKRITEEALRAEHLRQGAVRPIEAAGSVPAPRRCGLRTSTS